MYIHAWMSRAVVRPFFSKRRMVGVTFFFMLFLVCTSCLHASVAFGANKGADGKEQRVDATCQARPDCAGVLRSLTYYTEEYYPYNYLEDEEVRGFSADTLRLVWKELGIPQRPITLLPWARALRIVQSTPGAVLFSVARTPERESLFRWACPIGQVRFVLVARSDSGVVVNSLWDLQNYTIGTIRDDVTDDLLRSLGLELDVDPVSTMEHNLMKLDKGRIDLMAYEEESLHKYLSRKGLDRSLYRTVYLLKTIPVCFAFNRDVPEEVVRRFSHALRNLRHSPSLDELRTRYLLRHRPL
jgi:polar amino acid transport system substrate-binding protein